MQKREINLTSLNISVRVIFYLLLELVKIMGQAGSKIKISVIDGAHLDYKPAELAF